MPKPGCGAAHSSISPVHLMLGTCVACPAAVVSESASRQSEPYIVLCVRFIWETIGRRLTPMCALHTRRHYAFWSLGDMCERTEAEGALRTRESSAVNLSSSMASPGRCAHTAAPPYDCASSIRSAHSSTRVPSYARAPPACACGRAQRRAQQECVHATRHFREELAGRVERDLVEVV